MIRLESTIEKELNRRVKKRRGLCIKLTGYKGIPDRLVLLPGRIIMFVELKTPNGVLSKAQKVFHAILNGLGFPVAVISDYETLDLFFPKED